MWPGFSSLTQGQTWVEFVVSSVLCSEMFFFGFSNFSPLHKNQHILKLQYNLVAGPPWFPIPSEWSLLGKALYYFHVIFKWLWSARYDISCGFTFSPDVSLPNFFSMTSTTISESLSWQGVVVQTWMWYFPTGSLQKSTQSLQESEYY